MPAYSRSPHTQTKRGGNIIRIATESPARQRTPGSGEEAVSVAFQLKTKLKVRSHCVTERSEPPLSVMKKKREHL